MGAKSQDLEPHCEQPLMYARLNDFSGDEYAHVEYTSCTDAETYNVALKDAQTTMQKKGVLYIQESPETNSFSETIPTIPVAPVNTPGYSKVYNPVVPPGK